MAKIRLEFLFVGHRIIRAEGMTKKFNTALILIREIDDKNKISFKKHLHF